MILLLEMISVNLIVLWCVICALSWVERHVLVSPWKTTSGFLNSPAMCTGCWLYLGSGEKEGNALLALNTQKLCARESHDEIRKGEIWWRSG